MQAPKELILSVLEDVCRRIERNGPPTRRQEVQGTAADLRRLRRAPGSGSLYLCLQFEARFLRSCCQAVCLCKCVCGCLFYCLLIRASLCFVGWLVDWVYGLCVFVCFSAFAAHFRVSLSVLGTFLVLFLHSTDFGTPL